MQGFPSRAEVEAVKQRYPRGARVRLVHMMDEQAVPVGTYGTVRLVDDIGTIHVNWETGSSLGIVLGFDRVILVDDGSA